MSVNYTSSFLLIKYYRHFAHHTRFKKKNWAMSNILDSKSQVSINQVPQAPDNSQNGISGAVSCRCILTGRQPKKRLSWFQSWLVIDDFFFHLLLISLVIYFFYFFTSGIQSKQRDTIIPMRVHKAWASFMLWVVRIIAVFPCLVDMRDITSHINRFAIGSMPKVFKIKYNSRCQRLVFLFISTFFWVQKINLGSSYRSFQQLRINPWYKSITLIVYDIQIIRFI